jgi:hypothetical protein
MQQQFALDFTQKLPPATQARIAEGMQAADEHADERWRHIFDACVVAAARRLKELTGEDVQDELDKLPNPPETHNLSAIGPALKRAVKMGVIGYTGQMRRSLRPEKHGRHQHVWASKYYEGATAQERR